MLYAGIALAGAAALANSSIDTVRKFASSLVPSSPLVALPALLEALIACSAIAASGGFSGLDLSGVDLKTFAFVTLLSSALQLYAKLLYQKALALAPLSLTIPYLSCTPGERVAPCLQ